MCSEQHVNDCSQISKVKLCKKKVINRVLYNKLLSSLVLPETPTAPALSFVSASSCQPPIWANKGQVALCMETAKGYDQLHWTSHIYDIGMPLSSRMKPKALCCTHHKEAFGFPGSPPATWLELPGLSHFLSTVGHITHSRFHLFQYLVDDKMTLEKWATGAAEQVSKPIVRDTQDNLSPTKGNMKTTRPQEGVLGVNQCWMRNQFKGLKLQQNGWTPES